MFEQWTGKIFFSGNPFFRKKELRKQAPDGFRAQHRQWAPCLSVENSRHCSQEPASLTTKQDTPHLSRHQVSQVSTPEFQFEHVIILPYQGVSRFEFQLY